MKSFELFHNLSISITIFFGSPVVPLEILNDFLDEEIRMIIPELPIRLGTVKPEYNDKNFAERSYKVDFFAVGKEVNYLIEFKSDSNSRREKQDDYSIVRRVDILESGQKHCQ